MRKKIIVGGLVVVALLALVAGATYAIFSHNVYSDIQTFGAGTVRIAVNGSEGEFDTTLDMTNMEPGDCKTQTLTISSTGTLPVDLWNWIYTWDEDDTSPNIFNCDPNPNCNMKVEKRLIDDPNEPEEKLLYEGDYEVYELEACLPLCAGNNCQGGTGKMRMFFHAVQQSHLEGWNCVKLLYKEAPYWIPDPTLPKHGNKCYEATSTDGDVEFVVNGYGLTPNMPLQIMLNGTGKCTMGDSIIAGDWNFDGIVDAANWDPYYRGFWNEGGALSQTCDPSKAGEGVYAIAWGGNYHLPGDPGAVTDANGDFSGQWTAHLGDPCNAAIGDYTLTAKFLVKQDASPWLEELDELDYQTIVFDCP